MRQTRPVLVGQPRAELELSRVVRDLDRKIIPESREAHTADRSRAMLGREVGRSRRTSGFCHWQRRSDRYRVGQRKREARSEEARETNHANTTGSTDVLTRISSERCFREHTSSTEVGDGARLWRPANLLAKASGQSFDNIVAKFKGGVSDAHRSSLKKSGKHLGQEKAESSKPSIIPGPGIPENSILYTGITPIPSATVSRGVNPVPSPRP